MQLLLNFLLTIGIISTFVLSLLLFKKRARTLPRLVLGIIFMLLFFVTLFSYGELNHISWLIWSGFLILDTIGFLMGPLFYFYVISLFSPEKLIPKQIIKHLTPAILYLLIISIPFLITMVTGRYFFDYLKFLDQNSYLLHFQACYLICYSIWSLYLLSKYNTVSKSYYSNLKKIDLRWIKFFLMGIIALMLLDLFIELFSTTLDSKWFSKVPIITLALVILVVYLAYYGTQQSQILLPNYIGNKKILTQQRPTRHPTHHLVNASPEDIENLKNRLHIVLKKQKPYMDENLNLNSLAKLLPTSDRKLSALLNHYLRTTFYDLINSYRVEDVKEKMVLPEYEKLTLLAIAFESGFNSKTTFNRIFKKETGQSPSSYKKALLKKQ